MYHLPNEISGLCGDKSFYAKKIYTDEKNKLVRFEVCKHDETELENGIAEQTRQAILNLKAVLAEKKLTLNDVVKTTVFLADMNDFVEMNGIYAEFFDENSAPARSTVQVAGLPLAADMEIEAVASLR